MVNHPNRKNGKRYTASIPKTFSPGRVLVHNHVLRQLWLGLNGFRAWTQRLDSDPHGLPVQMGWRRPSRLDALPHGIREPLGLGGRSCGREGAPGDVQERRVAHA
jgi:hypothetical protein